MMIPGAKKLATVVMSRIGDNGKSMQSEHGSREINMDDESDPIDRICDEILSAIQEKSKMKLKMALMALFDAQESREDSEVE